MGNSINVYLYKNDYHDYEKMKIDVPRNYTYLNIKNAVFRKTGYHKCVQTFHKYINKSSEPIRVDMEDNTQVKEEDIGSYIYIKIKQLENDRRCEYDLIELNKFKRETEEEINNLKTLFNKALDPDGDFDEDTLKKYLNGKELIRIKGKLDFNKFEREHEWIKMQKDVLFKEELNNATMLFFEENKKIFNETLATYPKLFETINEEFIRKAGDHFSLGKSAKKRLVSNVLPNILREIKMLEHINILVVGKTGIGKSALVNAILRLRGEAKAKEGVGESITIETKPFCNYEKVKTLRLWDTEGYSEKNTASLGAMKEKIKKFVEENISSGNEDQFIHCIWFCVNGNRFLTEEENYYNFLRDLYPKEKLPLIFVYTYTDNKKKAERLFNYLKTKYNLNDDKKLCMTLSKKERDIGEEDKYYYEEDDFFDGPNNPAPCPNKEDEEDEQKPFGLQELLSKTKDILSEATFMDQSNIFVLD